MRSATTSKAPVSVGRRFDVPAGSPYKSIGGYGVIGNTRTVALVGYDGSIDWCCLPKFDSPSVFAAILDSKKGGSWSTAPVARSRSSQSYLGETNILRTQFDVGTSRVWVTDFMPCSHMSEAWSAPPEIHREVRCVRGEVKMRNFVRPRFDYARSTPRVEASEHGVSFKNAKKELVVASDLPMEVGEGAAESRFTLKRGETRLFILSYGEYDPRRVEDYRTDHQLLKTEAYWKSWVSDLNYRGRWRDEVIRSALVLKLLVYSPTGAIVAAPTTSLPERVGGERNWDYRYSWIRDSANSLWAFHLLGDKSEADRYIHWLIDADPALDLDLRLMYSIDGQTRIPERELKYLDGYKGSRPVRVGNAAARQLQLDAYGYMLDALNFSSKHSRSISEEMYHRFVRPLARYICANWKKPGNGIWEMRGGRSQFVYTKAWCYAGLSRAVEIAKASGHEGDARPWELVMDDIREEVLSKGWSEKKNAFVMRYGSEEFDSATLMIPLIHFLPATDQRVVSSTDTLRRELGVGPLLYRYKTADGFDGGEGAFLLCSFWLVACLARMGRSDEASAMMDELTGYANHLGLYSEEVDVRTGEPLGNFPQAFSHMGFVMAAYEIEKTRSQGKE